MHAWNLSVCGIWWCVWLCACIRTSFTTGNPLSISSPLVVKRILCLCNSALLQCNFEQYAVHGCLVVSFVAFRSFRSLQVQIQRRGAKEGKLLCGMPVFMAKQN